MIGYKKSLKKIIGWLEKKGFDLDSGKEDCIYFEDKLVNINFNKNQTHIIYSILHECGHLIVFNRDSYDREFSNLIVSEDKRSVLRTNRYKYELLKDEMLAWEAGLSLAKRLKIKIDYDDYSSYSSKCFMTYVKWIK